MAQSIERFADAGSARGYREFLDISADLHAISERVFLWRSVEDIKDTFNLRDNVRPATLRDVMRIRMGQTVGGVIRRHVGLLADVGVEVEQLDRAVEHRGADRLERTEPQRLRGRALVELPVEPFVARMAV